MGYLAAKVDTLTLSAQEAEGPGLRAFRPKHLASTLSSLPYVNSLNSLNWKCLIRTVSGVCIDNENGGGWGSVTFEIRPRGSYRKYVQFLILEP